MIKIVLMALLLAGCTVTPDKFADLTPADCRAYGANIPDGAVITGTIVKSEFKTLAGVEDECGAGTQGCAKGIEGTWPSESHQYEIYYAEHQCAPFHEACHALYENSAHTTAFVVRVYQRDMLAPCPRK